MIQRLSETASAGGTAAGLPDLVRDVVTRKESRFRGVQAALPLRHGAGEFRYGGKGSGCQRSGEAQREKRLCQQKSGTFHGRPPSPAGAGPVSVRKERAVPLSERTVTTAAVQEIPAVSVSSRRVSTV